MEKGRDMAQDVCLMMKDIGKPCTGKPYARFDEGALREDGMTLEHAVAASGEASPKEPETTARISALLYPFLLVACCHYPQKDG